MSDPTSGNASLDGGYLDPFPEMDEHGNMPSDSGESPVSGGGYLDPFPDMDEYGNTPGDIDTGGYKDPFPDMPSNYPSVSPEEEAEVLESLYDYSIGGLTKQIRSPAFDAMTTAEQDSLLEAYAGEMVKQGLYDESQMLYISPDLQDELGVRGVVWDPEATSLGAGLGTEMLSPISQTADRPVTLEEFMSDIGVSSDTPSGKRQTKFLREKLRHIAHSDDAFSPTTLLGPGLEGEVQTLGGALGQWFESEDKATFREDFPLWAVKTAKQAGQFMTYKFAIMAGAAASGLQDVYNNINNLPTVPGELQDIESRLVLTGLDAVGAAESLKRLGTATSMGSIYALSQEQIRQQDLQKMRSYAQGNEVFSPAISNAASFFYHLNRISARTGVSTAELLDMLPKWVELSELNPDMYSIEDLASDYINMQWKSGFQLAAEGAPDAEIETPVGTLVSSPEGSLEGAVSFARNVFNSFNRDVGFTEEERQLRAQMGASGELPQEVFGVGVGRAPWSPDAPGMDPVALDGKGVRFSERKNAQHQATEYWKNSTPDDAAKMDRYIRAELARRDTNAVYKAAENGLFGEAGRRNPDFFESMYTAQMINGQPIKRGMLSLYGLQMLYYFGRQMPYDMAASVLSTPLLLSTMSKEEVDRYADNLSSSPIMPMDMTKDEMVEMLEYGHAYHIREPLNAALDMMSAGTVGNYGLKSIVAGTQAGKYLRDPLPGLESSVQAAVSGPLHEPKPDMPPQSADPIERGAQTVREAIAERKNTELDIAELEALRGEPLTKREVAAIKYGATSGQAIAGLSALFTNAGYALGRARNRSEAFNRYVSGEKRDPDKPLDVYEERNQTPGDATTFDDPFGVGANRLPARIRADMAKAAAAQEPQRAPLAIEVGPWEEARRKAKRPTEKGREDLERAQADGRKLINPDTGREFMPPPPSRAGEGPAPLRPEVVVEGPSISRDKAREAAAEGDPAALAVVEAAREVVREDAVATVPITDRASRAKEFLEKTEGMGPEKSANAARRFVSRFYPSAPESWLARFNQAVRERSDHGAGGVREAAESTLKGLLDEAVMAPRGDIAPPPSLGVPEVTRSVPGAKPPKPDKMTRDMLGTEVKTDAEGMARVDVIEGGPGGIVQELGMFNKDGSTDLTTYISTTPMLQRVLAMAARGQGGRHLYEWMNNKHKEDPKGPGKALTSAELTMAAGLSMQRRAELRKSSTAASSKSIPTSRSASDRSVRHARHLYDEAVAAAAMREGVTPSEWLLINKVQEIAHSFVEMGVSDPSVYQQISKGGYTVSAKQASSLAQAGARRVGRPSVIPKDKFNAADAMRLPGNKVSGMEPWVLPREGESPYRALDTEATMTPESRFADMARRGDRIGRDTKLPVMQRYQFGTSDNPSWYKIASTFLDPRALDILTGREDVKVLGHSLNVGQRSLYAISEFMERPFAFANS